MQCLYECELAAWLAQLVVYRLPTLCPGLYPLCQNMRHHYGCQVGKGGFPDLRYIIGFPSPIQTTHFHYKWSMQTVQWFKFCALYCPLSLCIAHQKNTFWKAKDQKDQLVLSFSRLLPHLWSSRRQVQQVGITVVLL